MFVPIANSVTVKTSISAPIRGLLRAQLIIPSIISLAFLALTNLDLALSAFLGGLVGFLPSWLFARKLFQTQGASAARQILSNFYKGEFLKIISSILLFVIAFGFFSISPLAFFSTYIAVVMTFWLSPLLSDNK